MINKVKKNNFINIFIYFLGKRRSGRWHQQYTFLWEQLSQWSRDSVEQKERRQLKKEKKAYYARKHHTSRRYRSYDYENHQD